jgi:hypothetical protein
MNDNEPTRMWLTRDEAAERFRSQVALEAPELGAYGAEVLTQKLLAAFERDMGVTDHLE